MERTFRAALVGDLSCPEMSQVGISVSRELCGWEICEFRELAPLRESARNAENAPDLVIVCQCWRDEYSGPEVQETLAAFPVARWICVCGAWCESEGRHGSRWPPAVRVALGAWETRLVLEKAVVEGQVQALALTAARDEVFAFAAQRNFPKAARGNFTLAVISPDRESQSVISDLCRQAGYNVAEAADRKAVDLFILDLDPYFDGETATVQKLKQQQPQAKILGMMGLVTTDVRRRMLAEGVAEVLSKLAPVGQMLDAIGRLAQGQQHGE